MVAGQAGTHGRLAINPVEEVFRSVLGAAPNRLPDMAGKSATGIRGNGVSAIRTRAPVRTTAAHVLQLNINYQFYLVYQVAIVPNG